jgi:hypothetical protein
MLEEVLAILSSTPDKLRREIADFTPGQMKRRPAEGKWSVQEVLAHLEDVEGLGMRDRVEAMVTQHLPRLAAFDQEARAQEMRYNRIDPARSYESFARKRRDNLKWLRKLQPADLRRKGIHEGVGEITAGEMIYEWAFHDLGHLKQIMEVKRYALWPHMGNMQAFYKLQ